MQTVAPARLLDTAVFDLIDQEKTRQTHGLELIASENYASEQVMAAQGSVLTNKYAEGLPGKRYYGGCEIVDQVEQLAIDRVKELFGVAWANVQPHSGAQANAAVFWRASSPVIKSWVSTWPTGGTSPMGRQSIFRANTLCPASMVWSAKPVSSTGAKSRILPAASAPK